MINHRLLKAVIKGETATRPQDEITVQMAERRRLNRMAERDVGDWLYARFLKDKAGTDTRFAAEIVDISRGGMRVKPGPTPVSRRKLSISAVAACVFVWLITALSPLFQHLSYTLCAMNWFAARKTALYKLKVKRLTK